eukprot:6250312-Pyramimonas_sp.AAC.1
MTRTPKAAQVAGAPRKILPLNKNKPITFAHLREALAFIRTSRATGTSVVVHCKAGKHRSASIVCGYLVTAGVCRTLKEATAM